MNATLISMLAIFSPLALHAEPPKQQPKYVAEAPLPAGWSKPGAYNQVIEKSFPAYRAAYTDGRGSGFAFWRLFQHIKSKEIPMTSPVEMGMEEKGERIGMKSMGFLYQNTHVGKTGEGGKKIQVRDVPAMKTLSYTWQGRNTNKMLKLAKAALDKELGKRNIISHDYRVLGYNGPRVPGHLKTWEMIVVLPGNS